MHAIPNIHGVWRGGITPCEAGTVGRGGWFFTKRLTTPLSLKSIARIIRFLTGWLRFIPTNIGLNYSRRRKRQRERKRERQRKRQRVRQRERQNERQKERHRERQRERQRERHREIQREREREIEGELGW